MVKKDSLIKGTLILALAALTARALGLFQRIPLDYMLGTEGSNAFTDANQIYLNLLIVATAGFPSAISKMVSERHALGRPDEAKRIFHAGLVFGAAAGLILAVALYMLAPAYANLSKGEGSVLAVRAIAPALLFFPIIAMMRGYYQGRQMMAAGGTSQIVEQFLRVLLGIGLGLIVIQLGWGERWVAAAVSFGTVFGGIGALIVMLRFGRRLKRQDEAEQFSGVGGAEASAALMGSRRNAGSRKPLKYRSIYREIFAMSLPAIVTSMAVNLVYLFDTALIPRLTESYYGLQMALDIKKDFGIKAISLAGIPPILAIALGSSIIPIIASAYSLRNMNVVQRQASMVMRIVCFTGVPIALLLSIASFSITGLLFKGTSGYEVVAALTAGTILQITMMTSNSILYGMSKQRVSMRHTLIGLGLKVVASIALAPLIGVFGMIIGSTVCFAAVTLLNLRHINREVKLVVFGKRWLPYIAAVAISALAGWGAEYAVLELSKGLPAKLSYFLAAGTAAIVVGGLYFVLLIMLRVITADDISSLPGRLRKPFQRLMKLVPGGRLKAGG